MPPGKARAIAEPVGEFFLLTLAAQIATLPLMAWHFHQVSLSAILANPLILPAQPLVMTLGAVAMLGGMIALAARRGAGVVRASLSRPIPPLWCSGFAKLPGSLKVSESGTSWLLILLALAAGIYLLARRFPKAGKTNHPDHVVRFGRHGRLDGR